MNYDAENFSFFPIMDPERQKLTNLINNIKQLNGYETTMHKSSFLNRPMIGSKVDCPSPGRSMSPTEVMFYPRAPLSLKKPHHSPLASARGREERYVGEDEPEPETVITFGDDHEIDSFLLEADLRASNLEQNGSLTAPVKGIRQLSTPAKVTNFSDEYRKSLLTLRKSTTDQEQIEEFKNLLKKHPKTHLLPCESDNSRQNATFHRQMHSHQEKNSANNTPTPMRKVPLLRPFTSNLGTQQVSQHERSPNNTPPSGFLSDRRGIPKPDQTFLSTKPPELTRKRGSQPRVVPSPVLEKSKHLPVKPLKTTQFLDIEKKSSSINGSVTDRPRSQDHSSSRLNFVREFIDESFGGSANRGHYIDQMSNKQSMIQYEKVQSMRPKQICRNLEKIITMSTDRSPQRDLKLERTERPSYMELLLENTKLKEKKEVKEKRGVSARRYREHPPRDRYFVEQPNYGKAKAYAQEVSNLELKETFGYPLPSRNSSKAKTSNADPFNPIKPQPQPQRPPNSIDVKQLQTPKFSGKMFNGFIAPRPPEKKTFGQIQGDVIREVNKTYNKLVQESPLRQLRGTKIRPFQMYIHQPSVIHSTNI